MSSILKINPIIIISILALCAVILGIAGLKTIRLWNAFSGMVVGSGIGTLIYMFSGIPKDKGQLILLGIAAVCGVITALMKRTGSFIFCMISVFWMMNGIVYAEKWYIAAIYAGIALITAICAMIWTEPVLILVTSLNGAFLAEVTAELFCIMNRINPGHLILAVPVAAFVIGVVVQSMIKSREIGKKEIQYSNKMKKETSIESEVEQARAILDLDLAENADPDTESEDHREIETVGENVTEGENTREDKIESEKDREDKIEDDSVEKEEQEEKNNINTIEEQNDEDSDNEYEMIFVDLEK